MSTRRAALLLSTCSLFALEAPASAGKLVEALRGMRSSARARIRRAAPLVGPTARGVTRAGLFLGGLAMFGHGLDPSTPETTEMRAVKMTLGGHMVLGAFTRKDDFSGRLNHIATSAGAGALAAYGFNWLDHHATSGAVYVPGFVLTAATWMGSLYATGQLATMEGPSTE
jgi:hypothetical protein